MDSARSHARITKADLRRLARIAHQDREDFFERHPEWAILYRKRLLGTALCGNGALHYLNGITGVDRFEVVAFYAGHADAAFPFQRVSHADFGEPKFGRGVDPPETYEGLRVTLQGRSIEGGPGDDPLEAIQRYLKAGATPTARELTRKAVVMLEPEELLGIEAWPSLVLPPRR
jgi:hypothetical protein